MLSTQDKTRIDDTRIASVRPLMTPALLEERLPAPSAGHERAAVAVDAREGHELAAARQAGLAAPNVIADISSISILRTSLLAGLGHTLLPPMPMVHELERGELRAVHIHPEPLSRRVMLCSSRHIPASTAAVAVARLLHDLVAQLCNDGTWKEGRLIRLQSISGASAS